MNETKGTKKKKLLRLWILCGIAVAYFVWREWQERKN